MLLNLSLGCHSMINELKCFGCDSTEECNEPGPGRELSCFFPGDQGRCVKVWDGKWTFCLAKVCNQIYSGAELFLRTSNQSPSMLLRGILWGGRQWLQRVRRVWWRLLQWCRPPAQCNFNHFNSYQMFRHCFVHQVYLAGWLEAIKKNYFENFSRTQISQNSIPN